MNSETGKLPEDPEELKQIIATLRKEKVEQQLEYRLLEEKFLTLQHKFFARSSEKLTADEQKQGRLFNESEEGTEEHPGEETAEQLSEVAAHRRKKRGRKPLPAALPRREVIHELDAGQRHCECCGETRPVIGDERSEELDIIPAHIEVIQHVRKKYGPCRCAEGSKQAPVLTASMPARMIPGSIVSAGLLAYVLISKFCDGLPFYRLEKIFKRIDVEISRATMCNWAIAAAGRCADLVDLMWKDALRGPLVRMDETTVQVLKEPNRPPTSKSYMWVTIGYPQIDKPVVLYHYHHSRSQEIPLNILAGYQGHVQTDGYSGYNAACSQARIIHVGCFAHARRRFFDAQKNSRKTGSAQKGLGYIQKLYAIEKELRATELDSDEFVRIRRERSEAVLSQFRPWLEQRSEQVVPESLLGKAVNYALREWKKLIRYLDAWYLTPDNNAAEQAIRPFVVGRKAWLFSDTPRGAHASATLYSLTESAKINGLEPYRYFRHLFTHLPNATNENKLKALLPYCLTPEEIHKE
jgi:transposase